MQEIQLPIIKNGLTKKEITSLANESVERAIDNGNEIPFAEALSAAEQLIKEMKANEDLKKAVRCELEKADGGKMTSASGAKLELAETGTKYDYSKCEDTDLVEWQRQYDALGEKIKSRQDMLKTFPLAGLDLAMEETGEIVKVFPPAKSSTSSYKVTLAK
jgi:hypothetical protein